MTIGGYKLNNLMSNSTQNKVFNDLPEKDQKEIIRGAMKHAKRKQDEILDSKKQISNEVGVATGGKDIRIEDSTQNDEIKQMERAIDEGFAESEKFLKGMKTPFDKSSTQNDWEELLSKSLKSMKLGMSGSQAEWIFDFVRQQRADARREVIDRVESEDVVNRAWIKIDGNEFILVGKEFLATLREEEGNV